MSPDYQAALDRLNAAGAALIKEREEAQRQLAVLAALVTRLQCANGGTEGRTPAAGARGDRNA